LPLFAEPPKSGGETLVARDGDVRLYRAWLPRERADPLLASFAAVPWARERRKMYDRFVDVPREQAWVGDDRLPWQRFPELAAVRREIEAATGARFAFVLLNRYRDGNDSVAWHSDREVRALAQPVIASLTLGATRAFDLRPKDDRRQVLSVDLEHGDLVVMRGWTQERWEHRVAKDRRVAGERVNLTFRQQPE